MFNFFDELKKKYKVVCEKLIPYQIVMMGNYLLYYEGVAQIMTLTTNAIVFKVKDGVITVKGEELEIKDITSNTLTIIGKILSVERV